MEKLSQKSYSNLISMDKEPHWMEESNIQRILDNGVLYHCGSSKGMDRIKSNIKHSIEENVKAMHEQGLRNYEIETILTEDLQQKYNTNTNLISMSKEPYLLNESYIQRIMDNGFLHHCGSFKGKKRMRRSIKQSIEEQFKTLLEGGLMKNEIEKILTDDLQNKYNTSNTYWMEESYIQRILNNGVLHHCGSSKEKKSIKRSIKHCIEEQVKSMHEQGLRKNEIETMLTEDLQQKYNNFEEETYHESLQARKRSNESISEENPPCKKFKPDKFRSKAKRRDGKSWPLRKRRRNHRRKKVLAPIKGYKYGRHEKKMACLEIEELKSKLERADEANQSLSLENDLFKKSFDIAMQQKEHLRNELNSLTTSSSSKSPLYNSKKRDQHAPHLKNSKVKEETPIVIIIPDDPDD